MANIGISNASYYTDTSISRLKRDVGVSVEKIASNKSNITKLNQINNLRIAVSNAIINSNDPFSTTDELIKLLKCN